MFYNDDDLEKEQANWKNGGEALRTFAENHVFPAAREAPVDVPEETKSSILDKEPEDQTLRDILNAAWKSEVRDTLQKLAILADESKHYNNEKATYIIERAWHQVKEILDPDGVENA